MSYRNNILDRLQQFRGQSVNTNTADPMTSAAPDQTRSIQVKTEQFAEAMTAAHGEVIKTTSAGWQRHLFQHLQDNAITNLMVAARGHYSDLLEVSKKEPNGPGTGLYEQKTGPSDLETERVDLETEPFDLEIVPYDQKIEALKETLFHHTQAGLSGAFAGIAETGTLLVATGPEEPRALSLVPPVNYVVLEAKTLFWDQREAFTAIEKKLPLPTNLLLISGPSKTADIQQTLAYGAHGPKRLVVLLIED